MVEPQIRFTVEVDSICTFLLILPQPEVSVILSLYCPLSPSVSQRSSSMQIMTLPDQEIV